MVVTQHLRKGQGHEAVLLASRGLALANELGTPESQSRYSLIRGESHYALARAYASLAGKQPGAEKHAINGIRNRPGSRLGIHR